MNFCLEGGEIPMGFSIKLPYGATNSDHLWCTFLFRTKNNIYGYRICNFRNNYYYRTPLI